MCSKSKCTSEVYVRDFRGFVMYNGKRGQYPKNYDVVVKSGKIIFHNDELTLLYGEKNKDMMPSYRLVHLSADECHSKDYYVLYMLSGAVPLNELAESSFEPFGFTRKDLEEFTVVIDVKKVDDHNNPYQLVNSLYLAKKGSAVYNEDGEVNPDERNEKGRNGKLLYKCSYKKLNPTFFLIRNEKGKVEIDKSILSVPMTLLPTIIKCCRKLLTFLPMKLGEYFLKKQNPLAKFFGNIFFTPFVPVKFSLDFIAILAKLPILLFVADEKKYADSYYCLWKHELLDCFHELKSDCSLICNGKRPDIEDSPEFDLIGTWDELNVRCKNYC